MPPAHPRLDALGITYMALGAINLLWALGMTGFQALNMFGAVTGAGGVPGDVDANAYHVGQEFGAGFALIITLLAFPVGGLTLFAGMKMRRSESYVLAMVATFANMLPCYQTTCCAAIGIPIGIWSLITLFDAEVKASFQGR